MNNQMDQFSFDNGYAQERLTLNQYMARTFGWMFVGLMVTFALSCALAVSGAVMYLFFIPAMPIILLVAEVVVVLVLAARVQKLSVGAARALFLAYAVLNGMVFSAYFILYGVAELLLIFGLTALFFGVFALYGRFTHTDLSQLRPLLIGGLVFLLLAGILLLFVPMQTFERVICLVGIAVFLCFTAYDTQKIKAFYSFYSGDAIILQKAAIFSALQLYLDFINLFLYLLRFTGRRRN